MAAFQLEAETNMLFSHYSKPECLGQEKRLFFMQLTTWKESLALPGLGFVPCWHL